MTGQEQSKPTIGFIGMGHMGSHMATRLISAGYRLTARTVPHTVCPLTPAQGLASDHE